ncbi:sugar-binding protein, partial [Verrucomicrobiota bacterium]
RVFDVPRLDGIIIDGKADDWHDDGFKVEVMTSVDGWVKAQSDMDCRFSLGWDERGLLVLIQVSGQNFLEADKIDALYEGDGVELYLVDKRGGEQMIQVMIAPGMTREQPELRYWLNDYRADSELKATPPAIHAARTKVPGGYVMEALVPWTNIGVKPEAGGEVAFQMYANHLEQGEPLFNTVWYPAMGTFQDSSNAYRIRLAERPSPPFASVARAFARLGDAWFSVVAAPGLAGRGVSVRFNGNRIAEGKLTGFDGRALACVPAKLPEVVGEDSRFEVAVGEHATDIGLRDLENERNELKLPLRYGFHPFVFSGEKLPPGGFEDPVAIDRLLGPHDIKVSYYDAACNAVTNAPRPGRYGAVLEVIPRFHPPLQRYFTLFRSAKPIDWQDAAMSIEAVMPGELGLDPVVVHEQGEAVRESLQSSVSYSLFAKPSAAELLAWLHETPPGTRTTQCNGPGSVSARWLHELKRHTGTLAPLKYWVELPAGVTKEPSRKWPTILFLHGGGEEGAPVAHLAGHTAVSCQRELKPDTFIVIAPRCPAASAWSVPALEDLLDEVIAKYPIDADRLYLTGLSAGGYASWAMAAACPERFAAIVPLCGGGDPREVARFKDIPIWVFQGADDDAVPPERSREMVEALRSIGGRVRYTEYPDVGHACWFAAYGTPELYYWLLEQVRGKPAQPREVAK